ncbi:MAG TPA: CDP-alcohol phosphatidyltransferase family protein [Rhizomicrobium sp.]|nr:CDP-alcohol phosphatidyltransferase family protein [Rhizomicrobium sp.]
MDARFGGAVTQGPLRHAPNLLSALRLLAAPFAAWLILEGRDAAALLVFAACGASDALDGWLARTYGFASDFGAWLDPAADKLLMLFCFTALYGVGATPAWLLGLVVGRDAAIAGGWLVVKAAGLSFQPRTLMAGKLSTAAQIGYILLVLALLAFGIAAPTVTGVAAAVTGLLTAASGLAYAWLFLRGPVWGNRSPS